MLVSERTNRAPRSHASCLGRQWRPDLFSVLSSSAPVGLLERGSLGYTDYIVSNLSYSRMHSNVEVSTSVFCTQWRPDLFSVQSSSAPLGLLQRGSLRVELGGVLLEELAGPGALVQPTPATNVALSSLNGDLKAGEGLSCSPVSVSLRAHVVRQTLL